MFGTIIIDQLHSLSKLSFTYEEWRNPCKEWMINIYSLGIDINLNPEILKSNEYAKFYNLFQQEINYIEHIKIKNSTEKFSFVKAIIQQFVFDTLTLCETYEHVDFDTTNTYYMWPKDIPWRRSAIAFLGEWFGNLCISNEEKLLINIIMDKEDSYVPDIDELIQHIINEDGAIYLKQVPNGIPYNHWWWFDRYNNKTGIKIGEYQADFSENNLKVSNPYRKII